MKTIATLLLACLTLICSYSVANGNKLPKQSEQIYAYTTYKHITAYKVGYDRLLGTVTIKKDTKTGECYYNGNRLRVYPNPSYGLDPSNELSRTINKCTHRAVVDEERVVLYFSL